LIVDGSTSTAVARPFATATTWAFARPALNLIFVKSRKARLMNLVAKRAAVASMLLFTGFAADKLRITWHPQTVSVANGGTSAVTAT
jgi:hypothetical protein